MTTFAEVREVSRDVTVRVTRGPVKDEDRVKASITKWGADPGLVWDIYRIFESGDYPMTVEEIRREVIQKACRDIAAHQKNPPNPSFVYLGLLRRRKALNDLLSSSLVSAMTLGVGTEQAIDEILAALTRLEDNATKAICADCQHNNACRFGSNLNCTGRMDSNHPIHNDCPLFDPMAMANTSLNVLAAGTQFADEPGVGDVLNGIGAQTGQWGSDFAAAKFHGQSALPTFQSIVKALTKFDLRLFQLAQKIQSGLMSCDKFDDKTTEGGDSVQTVYIDSVADAHKAKDASLSDDDMALKVTMGDLQGMDLVSFKRKKQVMYVLIDCSGSMADAVVRTGQAYRSGLTTRIQAAAVIAAGFVRAIQKNGGICHFGFFSTRIDQKSRCKAETPQDYAHLFNALARLDTSGGGTDVMNSTLEAIDEIVASKQSMSDKYLSHADLLLITDMDTGFSSVGALQTRLQNNSISLHCIDLTGAGKSSLEPISKYYTVLTDFSGVDSIVDDLQAFAAGN